MQPQFQPLFQPASIPQRLVMDGRVFWIRPEDVVRLTAKPDAPSCSPYVLITFRDGTSERISCEDADTMADMIADQLWPGHTG